MSIKKFNNFYEKVVFLNLPCVHFMKRKIRTLTFRNEGR